MKTYKASKFSKYLNIFSECLADCFVFFIFPYMLLLPKKYVHLDIVILGVAVIIVLHYKVDRTYYPFFHKLCNNKVRLRYYDPLIFRPFFMSKFADVTIEFKDIKNVRFSSSGFFGYVYFYLNNDGYYCFFNVNGSTVHRFYNDLNQALEEYRAKESVDKSQS